MAHFAKFCYQSGADTGQLRGEEILQDSAQSANANG